MYIINVSFMVSAPVHGNWHDFVHNKFIPELVKESMIEKVIFARVLGEEVQNHFTYSLQMYVKEISYYVRLRKGLLGDYQSFSTELFDTEVTHFITVMKIIN